jgi:hypothetical protein
VEFSERSFKPLLILLLGAAWLVCASPAHAQNPSREGDLINWYYGAVFGTGVYRSGDRVVSQLQIPFGHELRAPTDDEFGLSLVFPVSFGFYDFKFDELLEGDTPKSLGTLTFFPGIQAEYRVTNNWRLTPYANLGWGQDLTGGGGALIYAGGVKSLVWLPIGRDARISLGNQLTLSGFSPEGGANQPLSVFVAGVNLEIPSEYKILDRTIYVGTHLIYYFYFTRLRFPTQNDITNKISEQGEVAFSLSVRSPINFDLFSLDRIGLGFQFGGGVQGVRLFFNLPY